MASTAIKTEEEKKEYFDTPEVLDEKCEKLAQMILSSEHFVAFTGAGISTACGIPDYRSGAYTCLPTGPGCWEKAANIAKARKEGKLAQVAPRPNFAVTIAKATPSKCHMSLVELMQRGFLKHIISQNIDGLHLKSGIPGDQISELHGNTNLEFCEKCNKGYYRDFRVRTAQKTHDHKTGRKCDNTACGGNLHDSIINFGECLRGDILNQGYAHGTKADLHLVLGSSLRVSPANDMVSETKRNGGRVVIVNLQKTPQDYEADFVIHAKMDDMFPVLMKKLEMAIPAFKLDRWAKVQLTNKHTVKVSGIDRLGEPYTLFKKIQVNGKTQRENNLESNNVPVKVDLAWQGHYNEPNLSFNLPYDLLEKNKTLKVNMKYNPKTCIWESVQIYTDAKVAINHKVKYTNGVSAGSSPKSNASTASSTGSVQKRASSINRTAAPARTNNFAKQNIVKPKARAFSTNKTGIAPRGIKAN